MNKGCIFDLDGTILDTVYSIGHNVNETLQTLGLPTHPIDAYKQFAGDGQEMLIRRALAASGDDQNRLFDEANADYTRRFATGCTEDVHPFDGITEMIQKLKERNFRVAVLSNKEDANVVHIIDTVFPKGTFDYVMGKRKDMERKPNPAGVYLIMKELSIEPEDCLYVGDTNTDMLTGKNAGLYTIGVNWGFRDEDELRKGGADRIVSHPSEIVEAADLISCCSPD